MFERLVQRALELVPDNATIGLGTGKAASAFIEGLIGRVKQGLRVRGVATSKASAELAQKGGIPVLSLEEARAELAVAFDGADEVDPQLNLIKGNGGALVREKIVAASAKRFIVLVGKEKVVSVLGGNGNLPVEIVPFGLALCRRRLDALGLKPKLREKDGNPFVSDNGNFIFDCGVTRIERPQELERSIRGIPGIVDTGLFLDMASLVLVQDGEQVVEKPRNPASRSGN